MPKPTLAGLLALSLASLAPPLAGAHPAAAPSGAQEAGAELRAVLRERLRKADDLELDELWREADTLVALSDEDGALDAAVRQELESAEDLGPRAELLLVTVGLQGFEPDLARLAERLERLVTSPDPEIARGAAGLLADDAFRLLDADTSDELQTTLEEVAKDGARPPAVRLEAAVALHERGDGAARRTARREIQAFLRSEDLALRDLGALALARTGDVDTVRGELERMSWLPGATGRLAESYLKQEDIRRLYDRKQKNLIDYYKQKLEEGLEAGTAQGAGADLQLVESLLTLIETTALEGDAWTRQDLVDAGLDGILRSLDAHSSYMTPDTYADFDQDLLQAEYGGIGAYVQIDREDQLFTITRPIYSGPAYEAGLMTDDKIVRIGDWPTLENGRSKPVDDVIDRLKGKPGTPVKLYVWRRGMDPGLIDRPTEDMAVEITREQITIPPVSADLLPGDIGLIELTTFSRVASQELARAIVELQSRGARAFVLDLRSNSGGLLTEAQNVSSLFLPKGKLVVSTESRVEEPQKLYTRSQRGPLVPEEVPVVVLVDRFSASASEIVAGALQDHDRARVVGQRSFGKGSVQQLIPIPGQRDDEFRDENRNGRRDEWEPLTKDWDGDGEYDYAPRARLTIARYMLPSGRSIHRELDAEGNVLSPGGVEPDHEQRPRRWEQWKLEEMVRLSSDRTVRNWVDSMYSQNRELLGRLADSDGGDPTAYPGFDAFYAGLDTMLTRDDVRFLVRREVRRRVQDDRGAAFPMGDYEEDRQLQRGIAVLLEELGESLEQHPEFAATFHLEEPDEEGEMPPTLAAADLTDEGRSGVRHALDLLRAARTGEGTLTPEQVAELQEVLQSALDRR